MSKILKTVQRDLTIIFDVLWEYVIDFVLNLVSYLLDLSSHPSPPALGPVPSCSVNLVLEPRIRTLSNISMFDRVLNTATVMFPFLKQKK